MGEGKRKAKQGMILTTAKNQQKHSDDLFERNSSILALQICILASWTIGNTGSCLCSNNGFSMFPPPSIQTQASSCFLLVLHLEILTAPPQSPSS
jgi:hypothetical protein